MPRVSDEYRARQRQRIIDATRRVVARKGISGFAMSDLIAESGLSAGAIYGYFTGRDEILLAVAESVLGARVEALHAIAATRPVLAPTEALGAFLRDIPDELVHSGIVLQIWGEAGFRGDLREHAAAKLGRLREGVEAYLQAWFREGEGMTEAEAAERATLAAPAMLALLQGFIAQGTLLGGLDVDGYVAGLTAVAPGLLAD